MDREDDHVLWEEHPFISQPRCYSPCVTSTSSVDKERQTNAFAVVLALLGVVTVIVRYRGQGGRLVRVISWDGGAHYMSLLGESDLSLGWFLLLNYKRSDKDDRSDSVDARSPFGTW